MADNNKKYNCNFCNYSTNYPCDWIKHTESDKHQRRGQKKHINVNLVNMKQKVNGIWIYI